MKGKFIVNHMDIVDSGCVILWSNTRNHVPSIPGLLILLPSPYPIPIERLIQILHIPREPFRASVDTITPLTSNSLTPLIAQLELLLNQVVTTNQLLRVILSLLLNLHVACIVLMRLGVVLGVAFEFVLEVGEGVEVVQTEVLVADLLQDVEVSGAVGGHAILAINYGVGTYTHL